jgi:hypothetical protein
MAPVTDLAAKIEERARRLDQVDQAIAKILRLLRPKRKRQLRGQLRLPFVEPETALRRRA